jgi:hypothetical protein
MDVIEGLAHIFKIRCSNVFKCSLGLPFCIEVIYIYIYIYRELGIKRFVSLHMISGLNSIITNMMVTESLHGH